MFWGVAVLSLMGLISLAVFTLRLPSPINRESLVRIQPGMTRTEVEAILGGMADRCVSHPGDRALGERNLFTAVWFADDFVIQITFDADNRVVSSFGVPVFTPRWYHRVWVWLHAP
jgi:hypothetical protein